MKALILCGGLGTRLAEETEVRPKPMVEIGSEPILWHIMKGLAHFGFKDFYIALGYRGDMIKRYFLDRCLLSSNMTINLEKGEIERQNGRVEDWQVTLIDTGRETMTGGRVKRMAPYLKGEAFFLTYGDGVSDLDPRQIVRFHRSKGKLATVTAVRPPARFGGIIFSGDDVSDYTEKPQIGEGWINGGFMVLEPAVLDYLNDDDSVLERDALEQLVRGKQLAAYRHDGFWQCMDTLRDKKLLNALWAEQNAPWRVWEK